MTLLVGLNIADDVPTIYTKNTEILESWCWHGNWVQAVRLCFQDESRTVHDRGENNFFQMVGHMSDERWFWSDTAAIWSDIFF